MSPADPQLSEELVKTGQATYLPNYAPKEIVLDRGEGARVWDLSGQEYLDFGCGISVTSFGHQNPQLVAALSEQMSKVWHASNLYFTEPTVRLAEAIVNGSFAERVFFCNSGAEANEAALKIARKYAAEHFGDNKREIITFQGSFHGRTIATVTATATPAYQAGFEPLPGGFTYCEFNDDAAIARAIGSQTAGVLVEPVQGEGGITPANQGFLRHLRELCDKHDALLMFDEIQSGMGRTGKLFAYEWEPGVEPDVVTMAKALGGGLPIGAVLVGNKAKDALQPGSHGSTFGGNPVAAAVAKVAFELASSEALLANVRQRGDQLREFLLKLNAELDLFKEVRGKGLMIGAELNSQYDGQAGAVTDACAAHGILVLVAGASVVRLLPPLTLNDEETGEAIKRLDAGLRDWHAKQSA